MNAHALACETTREPDHYPSTSEWVEYCIVIQLSWDALSSAIREEVDQ